MVAEPTPSGVTLPPSTVATAEFEVDHAMLPASSASSGSTVAVNVKGSSPTVSCLLVTSNAIAFAGLVTETATTPRTVEAPCCASNTRVPLPVPSAAIV